MEKAAKAAKIAKTAKMAKAAKTAKIAKKETAPREVPRKAATRKKASTKPPAKSAKPAAPRRTSSAKPVARRAGSTRGASRGGTFVDIVVSAIPQRRKRVSIADICARVDLSEKQVRSAVARAVLQGRLRMHDRGIYFRP